MKKFTFLFFAIIALTAFKVNASHFMGGNLYYDYQGINSSGN
jgi:hypothetical protein